MKNSLWFLFLFIITACGGRSPKPELSHVQDNRVVDKGVHWQSGEVIHLDRDSDIPIDELVDSIAVVQLETNDLCLISGIYKVLIYNGKYYILDRRQQNLFCFDQNGKFLHKIGERGRGPQEYEYLGSIAIDPYNEQLLLVVPFGSVLCYDLNGTFIEKISIPDAGAINELHVLNADHWLFVSLNEYQILYFSKKENRIVERLYERLPALLLPLGRSYAYNNSIYFAPLLHSETLNMSDKDRQVAYSWDFGANNNRSGRSERLLRELQNMNVRSEADYHAYVSLINSYLNHHILFTRESLRYRMAVLEYRNDYIHVLHDKRENQSIVFRKTKEGIRWVLPDYMSNQEIIIAYDIDGTDGYRDFTCYAKDIFTPEQLRTIEVHNPERDNPFFVVYYLKK